MAIGKINKRSIRWVYSLITHEVCKKIYCSFLLEYKHILSNLFTARMVNTGCICGTKRNGTKEDYNLVTGSFLTAMQDCQHKEDIGI